MITTDQAFKLTFAASRYKSKIQTGDLTVLSCSEVFDADAGDQKDMSGSAGPRQHTVYPPATQAEIDAHNFRIEEGGRGL